MNIGSVSNTIVLRIIMVYYDMMKAVREFFPIFSVCYSFRGWSGGNKTRRADVMYAITFVRHIPKFTSLNLLGNQLCRAVSLGGRG